MFMFDETDQATGWLPRRPKLQSLGCFIFGSGMFLTILLLFLALWFPGAWLGVAICAIPLLIVVGALLWIVLHIMGQ